MAFVLVDVIFFVVLLLLGLLWLTRKTSALDSCYLFHTTAKNWEGSNWYCQQNDGKLVSMETEEEYQFINKTIQNLHVGNNEWFIGLTRPSSWSKKDWIWTSGHSMTIDKWQEGEPSGNGYCVKMIKHYKGFGLFDDVKCSSPYMFTCEYKNVTSKLKEEIEKNNLVTCYNINNAGKKTHTPSVGPTSNTEETTITTKEIRTIHENVIKRTTSMSTNTSTISSKAKTTTIRKEQPFRIMLVVIVLAVLLAVSVCMFVGVFCWFRINKSGQRRRKTKPSRNPSPRKTASRSLGQDQSGLSNANSEGVQVLSRDAVIYAVPDDGIDYPGGSAHRAHKNLYNEDSSTYAEVHDAIPPSAKSTTKYDDDENQYLTPIHTAPTLDANVYSNIELNSKTYHDMVSECDKENRQLEEAIIGHSSEQQQYIKDGTTEPVTCNSLYSTTERNSKPSKALTKSSRQVLEQQYRKDATNEPAFSSNNLYSNTDLSSKANQDKSGLNQQPNDAAPGISFYNNLYATTDLIHLQDKATNEGLEQDGTTVGMKEDQSRDCQTEASNNGIKRNRHPSIGTIKSGSRKSQVKPSIATHYSQQTEEPAMYAMVDLLNNDKDVNVVFD